MSLILLQTSYFPLFTYVFFCILVIFWKRSKARKSPPGPWKLPVIGNLHHMAGPTMRTVPTMRRMQSKIGKILDSIINDHKVQRSKEFTMGNDKKEEYDFFDMLLNHQESNKLEFNLTTNQIKDVILDIIGGGSETSATTLEWAMSELLRNPGVMERAQAEVRQVLQGTKKIEETQVQKLEYLKSVLKETLRLRTPSPLIARESRDRCHISGYELPIKSKAIINEWALGRDLESWGVDAESFKPERFLGSCIDFKGFEFEYIPFGSGGRMCPGISFGVAIIELALSQLLYHFDWKLANGIKPDELDMTETFGAISRRKNDLYVVATPHFPSFS